MINKLTLDLMYWLPWIVIPMLVEILPAIINFIILFIKRTCKRKEKHIDKLPEITIIIPVYNSQDTLYECVKSIDASIYPNELIDVILVDNKSKDDSFSVFKKCQQDFDDLSLKWTKSSQGKSRALNLALFNATGKYIINIDSDGKLEKNALYNMIKKFETNEDIHCMTGIILTDADLIEETKGFFLRQIQNIEFMEYVQAFLAGRNFDSELNNIFTLSGAFSAFKKSTILNTQLYNTDTICEDTHLTFQIKKNLKKKVALCEDAIFIVDPIESLNKLYTQRQRWQIGELEVLHMFYDKKSMNLFKIITDKNVRLLLYDHTFAFPRIIWSFALIVIALEQYYSITTVLIALGIIYICYVIIHLLYFLTNYLFLSKFKDIKFKYCKKVLYLLLLPIYNTLTFIIRMSGIINSITRRSTWKTLTLKEEFTLIKNQIIKDLSFNWFKKERQDSEPK